MRMPKGFSSSFWFRWKILLTITVSHFCDLSWNSVSSLWRFNLWVLNVVKMWLGDAVREHVVAKWSNKGLPHPKNLIQHMCISHRKYLKSPMVVRDPSSQYEYNYICWKKFFVSIHLFWQKKMVIPVPCLHPKKLFLYLRLNLNQFGGQKNTTSLPLAKVGHTHMWGGKGSTTPMKEEWKAHIWGGPAWFAPSFGGATFYFLWFKTFSTWLRIDNDTSPVLERLWLENYRRRPTKRSSALSSHMYKSKVKKNHPSDCGHHAFKHVVTRHGQKQLTNIIFLVFYGLLSTCFSSTFFPFYTFSTCSMPDSCSLLEVINVSSSHVGKPRYDVPSIWNDDLLRDLCGRLWVHLDERDSVHWERQLHWNWHLITYDSKQSMLEVTDYASANNLERILFRHSLSTTPKPRTRTRKGFLMSRSGWPCWRSNRVEPSTSAQIAQAEQGFLCVGGMHKPDPWCTFFFSNCAVRTCWTLPRSAYLCRGNDYRFVVVQIFLSKTVCRVSALYGDTLCCAVVVVMSHPQPSLSGTGVLWVSTGTHRCVDPPRQGGGSTMRQLVHWVDCGCLA